MEEICRFADTNPKKNNYREAERILKTTDNLFSCGKDKQKEGESLFKKLSLFNTQFIFKKDARFTFLWK